MSVQLFVADKVVRLTMKRRFRRNPSVMELRAIMAQMPIRPAPRHIRVETVELDGIAAELLTSRSANENRALLYIHGGGFVAGVPANHRPLTWRLAEGVGVPVYAIDYRLAPEHPHPAALDDCVTAYRALLAKGLSPENIAIGGDSAGGNLTLATALKLKALGLPLPAALVCLSPVTDHEGFESRIENIKRDAMFDARMIPTVSPLYCPDTDPADPFISPYRGDVSGLPPTLFHCSRDELLRDDSIRMAEKMKAAGVDTTIEVWPGVFHVWQVTADVLPEAKRAVANIVNFLKERLGQ
ncbi:MAG TPA: alpha/beta hydrolase [Rhizomicrobium sp.]|nr:alpha/beta hydrolase [Rhizomicrobium sp.]